MKFSGYSFPHPVLGLNDDIEGNTSVVNLSIDEITDKENYILLIEYALDNLDLKDLVLENKAQFICEVSCTATLYRKSVACNTFVQNISIPKNYVRDKVELLFVLVASEPNSKYANSKAHSDFNGYNFDIDRGDVLAYIGESFFIAGIAYERLKAATSFMEIIKGQNEKGSFNIILDSAKIQIQLAKKDYELYCEPRIGKSNEYAIVFQSAIVLPSLIHALYQLSKDESIKDYSWAKIIEFRLNNDEDLKSIEFEEKNIPQIAQNLLAMPLERLLNELYNSVTTNPDN